MDDEKPPMEPILREEAEHTRGAFRDHPTPEQLVSFRAAELSAEDAERIEAHLALCPECEQLLQDLVRFDEFEPAEASAALADSEAQAAWQRLQPKLEGEGPTAPPVTAPERFRQAEKFDPAYTDVNWQRRLRSAYALAAALFFIAVGLSVWGLSQKRQVESMAEQVAAPRLGPIINPPDNYGTRGLQKQVPDEMRFSQREDRAIAIDIPLLDKSFREYEVQIADASERVLWIDREVDKEGTLYLQLTGRFFKPGLYRLQLYGVDGGQLEPLNEYPFEITPSSPRRP